MKKKMFMMYMFLSILVMLFISGCTFRSQDKIIEECTSSYGISVDCKAEYCIMTELIGFTGYDIARANYFQCMYINELAQDIRK